jgi:hypothetical protein
MASVSGGTLRRALWTIALIASLVPVAMTQEPRLSPPITARENPQPVSTEPATEQVVATSSKHLPFCPPKTCLYYAGDFNSADSNANGLFNGNYQNYDLYNQVWVGVKPPKAATVTGATFNQFFTSGFTGTNPTPFYTQIGIPGQTGKIVCNTMGNATTAVYGESDFGFVQYSFTLKKLKKPCPVAKPSKAYPSTYVSLLPTSDSIYGYLANVEDAKPKNHRGWKNDLNDCYIENYIPHQPPEVYYTCNSQGIGTDGFSELSIALTGKQSPARIRNAQPLSATR